MAAASPTPIGAGSHFSSLGRRTSARQALRRPQSRSQLSRSESNPMAGNNSMLDGGPEALDRAQSQPQPYTDLNDSSDDEIPVPMKLSAFTEALLDKDKGGTAGHLRAAAPSANPAAPAMMTRKRSVLTRSTSSVVEDKGREAEAMRERETRRHVRTGSGAPMSSSRQSSPNRSRENSPAPRKRMVRLSATNTTPGGSLQHRLRRSTSTSTSTQRRRPTSRDCASTEAEKNQLPERDPDRNSSVDPDANARNPRPDSAQDVNTPANGVRRVHIVPGSSGARVRTSGSAGLSSRAPGSAPHSDYEFPEDPKTVARSQAIPGQGSASRVGTRSVRKADEPAPQSSMRVKRIGKVPGSFLSGPARRGRRRQSEEENSPVDDRGDGDNALVGGQELVGTGSVPPKHSQHSGPAASSSFYRSTYRDLAASGSPVSIKDPARAALRSKPSMVLGATAAAMVNDDESQKENIDPAAVASSMVQRVQLPSALDQENVPILSVPIGTSALRKARDFDIIGLVDKPAAAKEDLPLNKPVPTQVPVVSAAAAAGTSPEPERKVLSQISRNTPHRPAPPPPPPKMNVLDAATTTAGAATTSQASKKQRVLLKVNGRAYHRLDCIGRGGSAKVYRVTAENGKMFALKRVSLENADTSAVKGFLGEIDLLKRLSGVDRVIQMYDSELNHEKQMLSVLMEMGELDLGDLLKVRHSQEDYRLDPVFVRFYWKEMLECLQAVHACDIVHSDLKPANFVLVKGRLKLIDFGIAGAIQTDDTVNVHRENQIGTPNYMSPESLMDSQHYAATAASNGRSDRPHGRTKMMKIGKPSDVWSLGCILYQLVYGTPPFGHIPHQMARCQAIIAWDHKIAFPEKGVGGVPVPPSLVRTMRRCLVRDQQFRPTCEELLADHDPFLYPQEFDSDRVLPITEEFLGRIIQSVVARCRDRMPTDGEIMSAWPAAYWASMKRSIGAATKDIRT